MVLHVSLAFASLPDKELDNFGLGVVTGTTGNLAYGSPPANATPVILEAKRVEFSQSITDAAAGGSHRYRGQEQYPSGIDRTPPHPGQLCGRQMQ